MFPTLRSGPSIASEFSVTDGPRSFVSRSRANRRAAVQAARFCLGLTAALLLSAPPLRAAEEICASCGQQVSVSGSFAHRKDRASEGIEGAVNDSAAFHEEIHGTNFTVSISHLPAGKYAIAIGEVEMTAGAPGERVFDVTSGDAALATNFDIFATVGGARKVCYIRETVEHDDDALRGPLKITFASTQGDAKFNTIEVKDAAGAPVVSFSASELADAFTASARRVPEISAPPIWHDASHPLAAREQDLIRRMSLAEKVAQLQNDAPAIPRLGLPAYNYWNEALHGVANNGIATVFPEPIGMAATWNPELLQQEGHVIGIEGRAKFNDYATKHNGDSKWWTGLTFWTPNINIFRDPRWGRGQETYGEDPFLTGDAGRAVHPRHSGRRSRLHAGDGVRQTLRGPQRAGIDAAPVQRRAVATRFV